MCTFSALSSTMLFWKGVALKPTKTMKWRRSKDPEGHSPTLPAQHITRSCRYTLGCEPNASSAYGRNPGCRRAGAWRWPRKWEEHVTGHCQATGHIIGKIHMEHSMRKSGSPRTLPSRSWFFLGFAMCFFSEKRTNSFFSKMRCFWADPLQDEFNFYVSSNSCLFFSFCKTRLVKK